jgi:hypothetical protein
MQSATLEPKALGGILAKFAKLRRVTIKLRYRRQHRYRAALEARKAKRLARLVQAIQAADVQPVAHASSVANAGN